MSRPSDVHAVGTLKHMPDYSLGKLYRIISLHIEKAYIGSTCERLLSHRLRKHVAKHKMWLAGTGGYTSSFEIIEAGDYRIELIELYPCTHHDELRAREQYWIREYAAIACNMRKALRTVDEERDDNVIYRAKYYAANRDNLRACSANYYASNCDNVRARAANQAKINAPA